MQVLVTGGAGYIGSHVVRKLIREEISTVVLDNLSRGHAEAVDPKAHFIEGDIGDSDLLEDIFNRYTMDAVLHFAGNIEVGESVSDPLKYYRDNVAGSLNLLGKMREFNITRMLFSSTAAVYGNPLQIPISEIHPRNPINPYGRTKMIVEMALDDFRYAYGLGYTLLRYFNVAGASPEGDLGEDHHPETHLIPRILAVAQGQEPAITLYGKDYDTDDGTCIRDYLHVEDLASSHLLALRSIQPNTKQVYNLGSEKGFSVLEVIEACRRVTGCVIKVEEKLRREGDPPILLASSAKIKKELGWTRRYPDLDQIIEHAWSWHRTHPTGYASEVKRKKTRSTPINHKNSNIGM